MPVYQVHITLKDRITPLCGEVEAVNEVKALVIAIRCHCVDPWRIDDVEVHLATSSKPAVPDTGIRIAELEALVRNLQSRLGQLENENILTRRIGPVTPSWPAPWTSPSIPAFPPVWCAAPGLQMDAGIHAVNAVVAGPQPTT